MKSVVDIEIGLLVQAVYLRYGHDFRDYAQASLKRRVLQAQQRMGAPSVSALQERVLHDAQQFAELLQYLTVPVSEMLPISVASSPIRTTVTAAKTAIFQAEVGIALR